MATKIDLGKYNLQPMGALDLEGRPIFQVPREQVRGLVKALGEGGKMVAVTFRKQPKRKGEQGEIRRMTGRFGCHKKAAEFNKTGVNRNTHADFPQYERIMETTAGIRDLKGRFRSPECQFRTFNLDTVQTVRGKGHTFVVTGDPCYAEQKKTDAQIAEELYIAHQMRR